MSGITTATRTGAPPARTAARAARVASRMASCLALAATAAVAGVLACAPPPAEPTEQCAAYFACFFPDGSARSTYVALGQRAQAEPDGPLSCYAGFGSPQAGEMLDLLRGAYGPEGSCWQPPPAADGDDEALAAALRATCDRRCSEALLDACRLQRDGYLTFAAGCTLPTDCDDDLSVCFSEAEG